MDGFGYHQPFNPIKFWRNQAFSLKTAVTQVQLSLKVTIPAAYDVFFQALVLLKVFVPLALSWQDTSLV